MWMSSSLQKLTKYSDGNEPGSVESSSSMSFFVARVSVFLIKPILKSFNNTMKTFVFKTKNMLAKIEEMFL